jgi:hypothetical protein
MSKLLRLWIILLLAFSLAACAGGEAEDDENEGDRQSEQAEGGEEGEGEDEGGD